ncbi:hypothetical protein Syun_004399 [Stephania yunnanensis]|uniref:Uncharacterized protein n=1 Tax=Stephania yunnanensis TaxID=152371 RepID=A0AAP0L2Z5_9MAGN
MGWRRAFCTTIPRDPEEESASSVNNKQRQQSSSPSPRIRSKFGFLSSSHSTPSTPRLRSQPPLSSQSLRCRAPTPPSQPSFTTTTTTTTTNDDDDYESPRLLHCKTTTSCGSIKSTRLFSSTPSSPRSPARFSLFKPSLGRFSKSNCGICVQSVKTGQGMAIFTAECSHAFHFPCIAAHVRKEGGSLVCPVCNLNWRQVPLLALHKNNNVDNNNNNNNNASPRDPNSNNPKKLYNDDEPLLSPTSAAAARFDSIPEVDEDQEIEEFQGFFVDPSSTVKIESTPNPKPISRTVDVKMLPVAAVVSAGRTHETYAVVLKVKAPPPPPLLDPSRRAPVDLVAVLDAGGSMTGAKLQMLKRAMRLVVSSLSASDRLSIVSFSSAPRRLMPLRRMTAQGQRLARVVIDRLVCGGAGQCSGAAAEALKKATKVLEDRRQRNPVATVMLLSDGSSTDGRRHKSSSAKGNPTATTRFSHLDIPVHQHGFGGGAEPAEDAFAKCVGSLLSVAVQDLRLQLGFSSGSAQVMAVYSSTGRPSALGPGSVRLGDLYSEEERELLVELKVPVVPVGAQHVMCVRCCFKDSVSQEVVYGKEQALLVPRPHAVRSNDPKIERLRNYFITTRAVAEARRLVEHGDLANAQQLLGSARALIVQTQSDEDLEVLDGELKVLRQRQMMEIQRRRTNVEGVNHYHHHQNQYHHHHVDENGEPLTPTSAWRAAEQLAKVAIMRKSMNRVSDLHGFENARF